MGFLGDILSADQDQCFSLTTKIGTGKATVTLIRMNGRDLILNVCQELATGSATERRRETAVVLIIRLSPVDWYANPPGRLVPDPGCPAPLWVDAY